MDNEIPQLPVFYVTSWLNNTPVARMEEIDDPFVTHRIKISLWDRFKSLFYSEYVVTVNVGGNRAAIFNVMNAKNFTSKEFADTLKRMSS